MRTFERNWTIQKNISADDIDILLSAFKFISQKKSCMVLRLGLHKKRRNELKTIQMWVYRRILRIQWVNSITNNEILRKMARRPEFLFVVKRRNRFSKTIVNTDFYETLFKVMTIVEEALIVEERPGLQIWGSVLVKRHELFRLKLK